MRGATSILIAASVALVAAEGAGAKTMPTLEQTTARAGDVVGVRIVGASHYLAPLRFYLVPIGAATRIRDQGDSRLTRIAVLDGPGHAVQAERFAFRVPSLRPGLYAIAMWFRGTLTGHWTGFSPWNLFPPGARKQYALRIVG